MDKAADRAFAVLSIQSWPKPRPSRVRWDHAEGEELQLDAAVFWIADLSFLPRTRHPFYKPCDLLFLHLSVVLGPRIQRKTHSKLHSLCIRLAAKERHDHCGFGAFSSASVMQVEACKAQSMPKNYCCLPFNMLQQRKLSSQAQIRNPRPSITSLDPKLEP